MGLILLRYGELGLKGGNRPAFLRRLRRNLRDALKQNGLDGQVVSIGQRVYVETDQVDEAMGPIRRVFGLVSASPAVEVSRDIDVIAAECVRQAQLAGVGPDCSFRVRARRADKTYPMISPEIDRYCGEAIFRATEGIVDLSKNADVTIGVEITRERVLVFGQTVPCPGGLPLGVEGRVIALMSGGIDSPVAAWMLMKRGCSIIPVHFSQNETECAKAMDNIDVLGRWSYGFKLRPIVLSHHEVIVPTLTKLREIGEDRWSCIFCKRALLEKAAELAVEHHASAIVMGDSLGQVASQTLPNMEVISHGIAKPILRPLIGFDKTQIIDMAREIGTFENSTRSEEACPFLPAHPVTRGDVERLETIIRRLQELEE